MNDAVTVYQYLVYFAERGATELAKNMATADFIAQIGARQVGPGHSVLASEVTADGQHRPPG